LSHYIVWERYEKYTTREMTPMITIPSVSSKLWEAAASACPPTIQFRMRNPWEEKTFKALGMMAPYNLSKK
jgi:hypothetical protein